MTKTPGWATIIVPGTVSDGGIVEMIVGPVNASVPVNRTVEVTKDWSCDGSVGKEMVTVVPGWIPTSGTDGGVITVAGDSLSVEAPCEVSETGGI